MHRFTIKRKISDTLLGATYECEPSSAQTRTSLPQSGHRHALPRSTQRKSSVAIKIASLRLREEILRVAVDSSGASQSTTSHGTPPPSPIPHTNNFDVALDDPHRERLVVAKLIASGGHQNVLQCYDHFTNDAQDKVYIVTEFCSGGDLFDYLRASPTGSLCERESLALITQVTNGLAFLHRQGFAHRDLSLENVLLRDDTCKLADFGAATVATVRCHDCVGKQQYMAPEVVAMASVAEDSSEVMVPSAVVRSLPHLVPALPLLSASSYDPVMADVWSLGVMLFILLTGSPLVSVASRDDPRFVALETHGVAAILTAWGLGDQHVSNQVVLLLESMLRVDPTKRISVTEVSARLRSAGDALSGRKETFL